MRLMAGIDLHSNNVVIGIMDMDGKRGGTAEAGVPAQGRGEVSGAYKKRLETVAVASPRYNWYWLVDGLASGGVSGVLANPPRSRNTAASNMPTIRTTRSSWRSVAPEDSATGYVYDAQLRPVRAVAAADGPGAPAHALLLSLRACSRARRANR